MMSLEYLKKFKQFGGKIELDVSSLTSTDESLSHILVQTLFWTADQKPAE